MGRYEQGQCINVCNRLVWSSGVYVFGLWGNIKFFAFLPDDGVELVQREIITVFGVVFKFLLLLMFDKLFVLFIKKLICAFLILFTHNIYCSLEDVVIDITGCNILTYSRLVLCQGSICSLDERVDDIDGFFKHGNVGLFCKIIL